MSRNPIYRVCNVTLATSLLLASSYSLARGEVNVYSARKEALISPALEAFSKEYRVQVNLITGDADALMQRLKMEGDASPADVFITVDAGRLYRAKQEGLLRPAESELLEKEIPAHLRDAEGYWFGLSQRARVIFYNPKKVAKTDLSTYEDLADPKWHGRICTRSSDNLYNQSMVAAMIEAKGPEATGAWIKGFVANLARPPFGGDTDLIRAVEAGVCDVTLANTYYYGRLAQDPDYRSAYDNVALFWPNQGEGDRGAHVNVSGIGITKSAKNVRNARHLMEYLANHQSQEWYAEVNNEYPVIGGVAYPKSLEPFGTFKQDTLPLNKLGENNQLAVELMNANGWK